MISSFVSETDLEEKRKKRQEEWERVRKPEDPVEAPEEAYDSRSLYDRLKEQKDKKQDEWDEAHKLKNMVRGLDDDEVGFLELVDKTKLAEESRIIQEERDELEEYRRAVALESEERLRNELKQIPVPPPPPKQPQTNYVSIGIMSDKQSQRSKLSVCVKRKSVSDAKEDAAKRAKTEEEEKTIIPTVPSSPKLPGIGFYVSSDSDSSSDSSDSSD